MQIFQSLDTALFNFINHRLTSPWLDRVMTGFSDGKQWCFIGVIIWVVIMIKGGRREKQMGLLLVPLLFVSDWTVARILKPLFDRPRPYAEIENVRLLVDITSHLSSRSFPSAHAANIFTAATFMALTYRKLWLTIPLFLVAALVGLSRVYLGVHYPFDVFGGAVFGLALGWLGDQVRRRLPKKKNP